MELKGHCQPEMEASLRQMLGDVENNDMKDIEPHLLRRYGKYLAYRELAEVAKGAVDAEVSYDLAVRKTILREMDSRIVFGIERCMKNTFVEIFNSYRKQKSPLV